MDALPLALEHLCHRVLRQPVDLEVWHELAELLRDGDVALRVPEPDRRGDVERAPTARPTSHPPRRRRWRDEVPQEEIDLDWVAQVWSVPGSFEYDEVPAGVLGERPAAADIAEPIAVAVDDEHRTANLRRQRPCVRRGHEGRVVRGDQRLGVRLEAPPDTVLDRFGRMRLREDLAHEEVDPVCVIDEPVVPVVLRPALVDLVALFEVVDGACRNGLASTGIRGADKDSTRDSVRVLGREDESALGAHGEAGDHRPLGLGGIQHLDRVRRVFPLVVRLGLQRSVGLPVAAAVEGDHAGVSGEIRNLHLPVAGMEE
jgi:hypothetical protein